MKKMIMIALVGVSLIAISCKKNRNCSCEVRTTISGFTTTVNFDTTFTKVSKKEAEQKCDELNSSIDLFGNQIVTTCELD